MPANSRWVLIQDLKG